ncbi:hypothetical protein LTR17_004829 [Elasticomyces elasticus]|nr:hypothetical protein LTR17_004829 [Elasticomyces elasticus]
MILDGFSDTPLVYRRFEVAIFDPKTETYGTFEPTSFTGSQETLGLCKSWLEQCKAQHTVCQSRRVKDWKPPHLLHWRCDDACWEYLVLCEAVAGQYDADVQYMTLSHRCTDGQQTILEHASTEKLHRGVEYAKLKRSIQDALSMAKHLGYEYLWVDSLCITQDDVEDCSRQVWQMDNVYSNSILNIAASDATNNDEGCFFDRDETSLQSFNIRLKADTSTSRRHRVYWECREMEASETWPLGMSMAQMKYRKHYPRPADVYSALGSPDNMPLRQVLWRNVVRQYTQRLLTFPEDKLRGLAGISGLWQRSHDDEYLFGIWRSALPRDLLWFRENYSPPRRMVQESYAVPSWSWACLDCPIGFAANQYFEPSRYLASFVGTHGVLGPRSSSGCSDGLSGSISLRLRGHIARSKWFIYDDDDAALNQRREGKCVRKRCGLETDTPNLVLRHPPGTSNSVLFDDDSQDWPDVVDCFPIYRNVETNSGLPSIIGLNLTPDAAGGFRRIGYFEVGNPDVKVKLIELSKQKSNSCEKSVLG